MTSKHDDIHGGPPSVEERALAEAFTASLEQLGRGRAGLDALPDLEANDELGDLVAMSHLLRSNGPAGELSTARRDALWDDIDRLAPTKGPAKATWWRWLALGVPTLAAVLLAVWWFAPSTPTVKPGIGTPPRAVATLARSQGQYALEIREAIDRGTPLPAGDTALRAYRQAHLDAWRADTTWHQRRGRAIQASRARKEHARVTPLNDEVWEQLVDATLHAAAVVNLTRRVRGER